VNVSSYLWSTGERSRSIVANQSGFYWVQLVSSNLCIARDTVNVSINPLPLFDLGTDRVVCEGDPLTLQIQTNVPSTYTWSSGQSTSSISINEGGRYTATALSDKGCLYQDQVNVQFNPLPLWPLPPSLTHCGDYTIEMGSLNPGSTFLWSDGSTSPSFNVMNSGSYGVVITSVDNCTITESVDITILTEPVVELGPAQTLCYGETATLSATSADATYNWSTAESTSSIVVTRSGTYSVEVTNLNGCKAEDDVTITVRPPLVVSLGEDRLLCNNDGITLSAPPQAVAHTWTSTDGFVSTERQIRIVTPGTYALNIRDLFNCSGSDEVRIQPTTQNITANFLVPSIVDQGNAVHFVQLSEPTPTTFEWSFGDGSVSAVENPVYRYFRTGEFRPRLVVSNGVCSDTLVKVITVRAARTEIEETPAGPQLIELIDAKPFPNPFSERLDVEIELTAESDVWLYVYTLDGVLIQDQQIKLLKGRVPLDMSKVSDGVYLLQVIVNNKTSLLKIMKVQRG
jgi:PKD repeat protein